MEQLGFKCFFFFFGVGKTLISLYKQWIALRLFVCLDLDECSTNDKLPPSCQTCSNTVGGFMCTACVDDVTEPHCLKRNVTILGLLFLAYSANARMLWSLFWCTDSGWKFSAWLCLVTVNYEICDDRIVSPCRNNATCYVTTGYGVNCTCVAGKTASQCEAGRYITLSFLVKLIR